MSRVRSVFLLPLLAAIVLMMSQSIFVDAAPAHAAGMTMPMPTADFSPTDESKVPHYFGPYPNWANSPQTLADALVTIEKVAPAPGTVGNALIERALPTDSATEPGTLAQVLVVLPNAKLPAGTLSSFQIWNQTTLGVGPSPSAGNLLHAYVLRPDAAVANKYTVVFDSGELTVPVPTEGAGEVTTFDLATPVEVEQDDVIGFYGAGVPLDAGTGADILSTPASADVTLATAQAPPQGDAITLGVDSNFPLTSQDRTYSFSAIVTPTGPGAGAMATATVDPKTGGVSGITITEPGSGYATPPVVTISSPGVTPTALASAHATISSGVVSRIDVAEAGFGFTSPTVQITGGGSPSAAATAQASGGVDNLTIVDGGSGYQTAPLVNFSNPDAEYCSNPGETCEKATAKATMNASGNITGIELVSPGSGYATAPSLDISDAGVVNGAGAATVKSTISISRVAISSGGAGYDSEPIVTINDSVAPFDKGASAVATVAVMGAVTAITVDHTGSGYLTPGLKKFVDTLPGDGEAEANNMGQYIPIAVPDTTTYPGTDYYEIAIVQYREKFASSMPATLLRGYVQLSTDVVPGKHVELGNANLDPSMLPTPTGYFGVDTPHYLGPTIVATKDRPVRVLFRNLLPTGTDGNLFLPVDTTFMGAGEGPNMMTLDPTTGVPQDMAADEGTVTDGIRNPMCGEDPKPSSCYSENRAIVHLHGGITPWISDGNPHQWTTPAGESTDYPAGVSMQNVPDMPDPGPGAQTFFYTNQQSARLLFYHDHAWGITRLNVYAGAAAPYLITDPTEQKLIGPGGALNGVDMGSSGVGHSLTIQDKTFVPDVATMAKNDPTWNYQKWGGEGNLWQPHVYMPAQNPGSETGSSPFGRWMYGPWFWPPSTDQKYKPIANPYYDPTCDPDVQAFCEPPQIPSTPNQSAGMEAFQDTPIVNGTAYPTTTVDPKAYRFRILNAADDRFWNLSWFVADPTTGTLTEVALKKSELEAAQSDPVVAPTVDQNLSPKGPDWIQIGTDAGFLPAPAVIPAHDMTYITDPTRFDVGNGDEHSLLLAPAERADVVVDFSQYRGKTLILYNDAPAAFPARVPGYDYYTGDPDQTPVGAPTTLPGYGPNTRTIMQVKVSMAAPAVAFDRPNTTNDKMGALVAAFAHQADGSGVFESGQNPTIVGQAAYNSAYGTNFVGTGYCSSPVNPTAKCDGFARINQQGHMPFKFDTLSGTQVTIPLQPKAIHDETNAASFDPYGRMMGQLGVEAPGATPLLQNIVLEPFVNPATEILDATSSDLPSSLHVTPISTNADGTQIWKITHNGVDTHPIHWHLYDVQLINRVTWDNIIIPPEPNELGWKDTIRVSPLEDTYVAVRPILPTIPFGLPDSIRPLNPMMPLGAKGSVPGQVGSAGIEAGFNNTDVNGDPIDPIVNEEVNFHWEYMWHCHILSHEEMDMMRPQVVIAPEALATASVLTLGSGGVLHWNDPTPVDLTSPSTWTLNGSARGTAEIGYKIQRADVLPGGGAGAYSEVGKALANTTSFTVAASTGTGFYRAVAWTAAGETASNAVLVSFTAPDAPTNVVGTSGTTAGSVDVTWSAPANDGASPITGYEIQRSPATGGPTWTNVASVGNVMSTTVTGLTGGSSYIFQVRAINAVGNGAWSAPSASVLATTVPSVVTGVVGSSPTQTSINVSWSAPANGGSPIVEYAVLRSSNGGLTWLGTTYVAGSPAATSVTLTGLSPGTQYVFQVAARNSVGWGARSVSSAPVSTLPVAAATVPAKVSGVVGSSPTQTSISVSWAAPANGGSPVVEYAVLRSSNGGLTWLGTTYVSGGPAATSVTLTGLSPGTQYVFQVAARNSVGWGARSVVSAPVSTLPVAAPTVPSVVTGVVGSSPTQTSINVSWAAPANGGSPVVEYAVLRSSNGGLTWLGTTYVSGSPAATSVTLTGLSPGTQYVFQVAARNSVGWGARSTSSVAVSTLPVAGATVPSVVSGVVGSSPTQTSISVSWAAPANGGSPVVEYAVRRSSDGGLTWLGTTYVSGSPAATSVTLTGLSPGTQYVFQVAARNSVGWGARSVVSAAVSTLP